jgi:hypothetical protein
MGNLTWIRMLKTWWRDPLGGLKVKPREALTSFEDGLKDQGEIR